MTTPTLEEMKENVLSMISDFGWDVNRNTDYIEKAVEELYTTAKREALREVQSTIMSMKPYPTEPRMHQSYNDGKRDLADDIITHLESELNSGAESK